MASKVNFLLALAATVVAASKDLKDTSVYSREPIDNSDVYDCSGQADGNYPHPTDCTMFIMCSNGRTIEMPCADCDKNNVNGCAGSDYLFWDQAKNQCEWPQHTDCAVTSGETEVTPPTSEATTPTPDWVPKECTESEGSPCEKEDCHQCGYCVNLVNYYYRCVKVYPDNPKDKVNGTWVLEQCDKDLWWNEEANDEGGACTTWTALPPKMKAYYWKNGECNPYCEWGQDEADKCTGKYWYYDPKTMTSREDLECAIGLKWDPTMETCRENIPGC